MIINVMLFIVIIIIMNLIFFFEENCKLSFIFYFFSFFKECPHPDDKQRKELSRELGLEPLQVKFWFQNKRTQMKVCYNFYAK
jgi:hypothetical protein